MYPEIMTGYNKKVKTSSETLLAFATNRLYKAFEVIFTIMIRELFIGFDVLLGDNKNTPASVDRLAIRTTGMVDIASHIISRTAIDIEAAADTENITIIPRIPFVCRDTLTDIFDDCLTFLDRSRREKPEPAPGAPDLREAGCLFFHKHIIK
jgi:hypothetical protein